MKEVLRKKSTNGRWGLSVVSNSEELDFTNPIEGELTYLGQFEGFESYEIIPKQTGIYYFFGGDIETIEGAKEILRLSLQSYSYATIVAFGEFSVLKQIGYKRRSSKIIAFKKGDRILLPPSVLAAMGILPTPKKEIVNPVVPGLTGELAVALKAAGL